jgi:hypothetical protein
MTHSSLVYNNSVFVDNALLGLVAQLFLIRYTVFASCSDHIFCNNGDCLYKDIGCHGPPPPPRLDTNFNYPPFQTHSPIPSTFSRRIHPSHPSMPPKLRGSLTKSLSHAGVNGAVFYCPSCTTWRRTLSTRRSGIASSRLEANRLSFLSSRPITTSSVVHARHVPPRLRELYEALNQIQGVATEQVNISRLQLALRGLESEAPIIRVAGRPFICDLPLRHGS